jgi:hypothetical protein
LLITVVISAVARAAIKSRRFKASVGANDVSAPMGAIVGPDSPLSKPHKMEVTVEASKT